MVKIADALIGGDITIFHSSPHNPHLCACADKKTPTSAASPLKSKFLSANPH
jgi:hypothetical protein